MLTRGGRTLTCNATLPPPSSTRMALRPRSKRRFRGSKRIDGPDLTGCNSARARDEAPRRSRRISATSPSARSRNRSRQVGGVECHPGWPRYPSGAHVRGRAATHGRARYTVPTGHFVTYEEAGQRAPAAVGSGDLNRADLRRLPWRARLRSRHAAAWSCKVREVPAALRRVRHSAHGRA